MNKKIVASMIILLAELSSGCDDVDAAADPVELESAEEEQAQLLNSLDPDVPVPPDEGPVVHDSNSARAGVATFADLATPPEKLYVASPCPTGVSCPTGMCDRRVVFEGRDSVTQILCMAACDDVGDCNAGETCGDNGFCSVVYEGSLDYCVNEPCAWGEGDCDSDDECTGVLQCLHQPGVDHCGLPPGHYDYCREKPGGCVTGEGDCDRDSECRFSAHVCRQNIGSLMGFPNDVDLCWW